MVRWIVIAAVPGLLGACGSFDGMAPVDPPREVLGVSAPQAGPADAAGEKTVASLQWKVSQICTRGAIDQQQSIELAADDKQFVDWQFRCAPYRIWMRDLVPASLPF